MSCTANAEARGHGPKLKAWSLKLWSSAASEVLIAPLDLGTTFNGFSCECVPLARELLA